MNRTKSPTTTDEFVYPDPRLRTPANMPPQLRQYAPQAAQLATQAGQVAKKAALWLGLWILSAVTGTLLLIMLLLGYSYAGPLLLLLLLANAVMLWQQLGGLRRSAPLARLSQPFSAPRDSDPQDAQLDERTRKLITDLQHLSRSSKVGPLQEKLSYTSNLIAEALRATAAQGGLVTRETHDVRMAAERDLPEALRAFASASRTGASGSYAEVLLAEQLQLIQERMLDILAQSSQTHLRDLETQRDFVQDTYKRQ